MTFDSLGLKEPILEGIRLAGYTSPTDIQAKAIPIVLSGRDIIALGETGSGKTAAFGLPILDRLVGGPRGLRALILVPTRELCVQVAESLRAYAAATELAVCTAFGGIDLSIQRAAFKRGLDVLVACPGRLLDHLQQGSLTLADVEVVVLDEADRMLDMGFLPQIRSIFVRCPQQRQNLLFSATMPRDIEALCADFLPEAVRVQVGRRSQAARTISHAFAHVAGDHKVAHLRRVLERESGRVLIFVKTKTRAEQLGNALKRAGLPADSIHGDKGAEQRYVALKAFERGRVRFLVATDVAARGIDVSDIALVINFDMPRALEDYVHRVGRTGRAGNTGRALSLVASSENGILASVKRHLEHAGHAHDGQHGHDGQHASADADEPRREREAPRDRSGRGRESRGARSEERRGGPRSGEPRDASAQPEGRRSESRAARPAADSPASDWPASDWPASDWHAAERPAARPAERSTTDRSPGWRRDDRPAERDQSSGHPASRRRDEPRAERRFDDGRRDDRQAAGRTGPPASDPAFGDPAFGDPGSGSGSGDDERDRSGGHAGGRHRARGRRPAAAHERRR